MRKLSLTRISLALAAAAGAAVLTSHPAAAQDSYPDDGHYDSSYDGSNYDDDDARGRRNPPPAGADVAYDYLSHDYYRYEGPAPQAPAAREQRGFRDGQIEREPRTSYYSGVRLVYPYRRWNHRCGCWYGRSHYGRYDDGIDYRNAYPYTYSYSTRRYTDHHLHHSWLW